MTCITIIGILVAILVHKVEKAIAPWQSILQEVKAAGMKIREIQYTPHHEGSPFGSLTAAASLDA